MERFRVHVAQSVLDDLRARLLRTRWSPRPGAEWTRGTDRGYLRELVAYWLDGYDWREHEARLNELPHRKARVDGADVHFLRLEGGRPPLLLRPLRASVEPR